MVIFNINTKESNKKTHYGSRLVIAAVNVNEARALTLVLSAGTFAKYQTFRSMQSIVISQRLSSKHRNKLVLVVCVYVTIYVIPQRKIL